MYDANWFSLETKLKTTRINNISLFVTVLSACLLAVGTSAQICAQPSHSVDPSSASSEKNECGKKVRQIAKRSIYQSVTLRPRVEYDSHRTAPDQVFTENTRAIVDRNSVLIVTRLPRAGLENPLAEQPAVN
jgi:hypothetical protein